MLSRESGWNISKLQCEILKLLGQLLSSLSPTHWFVMSLDAHGAHIAPSWVRGCVHALVRGCVGIGCCIFSGLDIQPTHPLVPPPSNPPIQPAIHLATQLSIRPATHSPIHPSTHPPIHPSSHPPNHFSTHDLRHTSMHRAFRRCIQPATHVAIQASSQPPNHPPTHVGVLGWMRSWWMGGCMGAWVCA